MCFKQAKRGLKQTNNNKNINKGHDSLYVYNGNGGRVEDPGQKPSGMIPNLITSFLCPPCGESTAKGGVRGFFNKVFSFYNPPTALQATSPTRGADKSGFTLIELLVVVLIIGILAAVALPQYKRAVVKAHVAQIYTIFNAYKKAIDLWWLEDGNWTQGQRRSFTGTRKNAELDIELSNVTPSTTDPDTDRYNDINVSAFVAAGYADVYMYVFGTPNGWLDGCGVFFAQWHSDGETQYRYGGVVRDDGVNEVNLISTVPAQCTDLAKIMCDEWGPTGWLTKQGAAQCGVPRRPIGG